MSVILATTWWSLLIRGIAALALGILALAWREISIYQLTLLFFGYAMIHGVVNLAGAISAAEAHQRWASLLIEALAGIAAAIIAVAWPGVTEVDLIYIVAAWGLATGAPEIASAVRLRRRVRGEWMLALSGIASIVLGILMVALPLASAFDIALWLGVYALLIGALLTSLALRHRARFGTDHRVPLEPAA